MSLLSEDLPPILLQKVAIKTHLKVHTHCILNGRKLQGLLLLAGIHTRVLFLCPPPPFCDFV